MCCGDCEVAPQQQAALLLRVCAVLPPRSTVSGPGGNVCTGVVLIEPELAGERYAFGGAHCCTAAAKVSVLIGLRTSQDVDVGRIENLPQRVMA